jgi:hypothetical protein
LQFFHSNSFAGDNTGTQHQSAAASAGNLQLAAPTLLVVIGYTFRMTGACVCCMDNCNLFLKFLADLARRNADETVAAQCAGW